MRANVMMVGAAFLLVAIAIVLGRKFIVGAVLTAGRRIPAIARLQVSIEAARFFSIMGAMTRSGVPLADAMAVAGQTIASPRDGSSSPLNDRAISKPPSTPSPPTSPTRWTASPTASSRCSSRS